MTYRTLSAPVIGALVLLLAPVLVLAQSYFPDYYSQAGSSSERATVDNGLTESVDPFTGKLNVAQVDLVIPGQGGLDLAIVRTYTSLEDSSLTLTKSPVGLGWRMHFGRVHWGNPFGCGNNLTTNSDNPVFETQDGARQMFFSDATGQLISRDRWKLVCNGLDDYVVYSPDGTAYTADYNAVGDAAYVTEIKDRNNNTISISYQQNNLTPYITSISTSDGRSLTFSYTSATTDGIRLSSISGHGRTWTYTHTAVPNTSNVHYYLTQVNRPDGKKWKYEYNPATVTDGRHSMDKLVHPHNGEILYEYDNIAFDNAGYTYTVVDKKDKKFTTDTSGGVWTFSYSQNSTEDTTTVVTPDGRMVYKHYGVQSAGAGTVWRIGLLKRQETRTSGNALVEAIDYTWSNQMISTEPFARPPRTGLIDADTFAPVLTEREITRYGDIYRTQWSNFDTYGNPRQRSETGPNTSRSHSLTYSNNTTKWILGLETEENISTIGAIKRGFDSSGNMLWEETFGRRYNFTYHSTGDLKTIKDPRNYTTTFSNYYRGTARSISRPESVTISRVVNSDGTVASETNGRGKTTIYSYDDLGRVTTINPPAGSNTNISHGTFSRITTRGTYRLEETLNGFGQVTDTDEESIDISRSRDVYGRITYESYPDQGVGTTYRYDVLGSITKIIHGDGLDMDYRYLSGNKVEITNERGYKTDITYQSFGDPNSKAITKIDAPEGQLTTINRNKIGLITSVVQGGKTRGYGYNSKFDLTSMSHPEVGTVTYGYDSSGNRTSETTGGRRIDYEYDGLNRRDYIDYNSSSSNNVTITYDKNDNVTSVRHQLAERRYEYSNNDVLTKETLEDVLLGVGPNLTVTYSINNLDHVTSVTYPSGRVVALNPDDLGRPDTVGGFVTNVNYHGTGQPSSITYGNGKTMSIDLDSRRRVDQIEVPSSVTANRFRFQYDYDGVGNLLTITDVFGSDDLAATYDQLNRLKTASGSWGTGTLTYDNRGNIKTFNLGGRILNYSYNSSEELTSVTNSTGPNYSFHYDSLGRIDDDGFHTYNWDRAGNLLSSDGFSAEYDGNNMRYLVIHDTHTRFQYHDAQGRLLGEYNNEGGLYKEYMYLGRNQVAQVADIPEAITNLEYPTERVEEGDYEVTWDAVTEPGYEVRVVRQRVPFNNYTDIDYAENDGVTENGLEEGRYKYEITVCNVDLCSPTVTTGTITVFAGLDTPGIPAVPSTPLCGNSFNVSWTAVTSGDLTIEYDLERDTSSSFSSPDTVYEGTATQSSQTQTSASSLYRYRVRACTDFKGAYICGEFSNPSNGVRCTDSDFVFGDGFEE